MIARLRDNWTWSFRNLHTTWSSRLVVLYDCSFSDSVRDVRLSIALMPDFALTFGSWSVESELGFYVRLCHTWFCYISSFMDLLCHGPWRVYLSSTIQACCRRSSIGSFRKWSWLNMTTSLQDCNSLAWCVQIFWWIKPFIDTKGNSRGWQSSPKWTKMILKEIRTDDGNGDYSF